MKIILSVLILLLGKIINAQITPEIYSWKQNLTGITGYNGILADVQQVFYSANYSYVKCTGIPSYTIRPWAMNPDTPLNQNWTFKIARFRNFLKENSIEIIQEETNSNGKKDKVNTIFRKY